MGRRRTGPEDGPKNNPIAARIPDGLREDVEAITFVEGVSLSSLVVEGLQRVVNVRHADPTFRGRLHEALATQVSDLETQLAAARTMLDRFPPSTGPS